MGARPDDGASSWRHAPRKGEKDEEEGEETFDAFARAPGRCGSGVGSSTGPPATPNGWQVDMPKTGTALVGWHVQAMYKSGPRNELRWHPAIVLEEIPAATHVASDSSYKVFVVTDSQSFILKPPYPTEGVIFVKATTKAHFEYFSLPKSKGPIASAAQLAHAKELAARQTVADDDDD